MTTHKDWLSRISRRDFLEGTLATAAGLSVLPSCATGKKVLLPPHGALAGEIYEACHARAGESARRDALEPECPAVAILGGGLSGLSAGWALKKLGIDDFVIFDKEPVAGGHARTAQLQGRIAAAGGASSLEPWGELLVDFYRSVGVVPAGAEKPEPQYLLPEPANRSFIGGRWVDDAWGEGMDRLPLGEETLTSLKRLRASVRALGAFKGSDGKSAFDVPADESTEDDRVRGLDEQSFAAWAASLDIPPEVTAFFDPFCRADLGMTPGDVSAWAAIGSLQSEWSPSLARPGGTAYLAERLVRLVGQRRLKLSRIAVHVAPVVGGVEVTTTDPAGKDVRTLRAKRAIVALPKYIAGRVVAELPQAQRAAWQGLDYRPYLVANLALRELDPSLGYDNWLHRGDEEPPERRLVTDVIVADIQERRGAGGPGLLTAYCPVLPPFTRRQLVTEPYEVWAERIVSAIEPALPGLRERLLAMDLFRWGHARVTAPPGAIFGGSRALAMRAFGPLHFAHTDLDGVPAVEGAIAHGVRAGREAAKALGVRIAQ
jgi:phytoene dehydrogenase-like protein